MRAPVAEVGRLKIQARRSRGRRMLRMVVKQVISLGQEVEEGKFDGLMVSQSGYVIICQVM